VTSAEGSIQLFHRRDQHPDRGRKPMAAMDRPSVEPALARGELHCIGAQR